MRDARDVIALVDDKGWHPFGNFPVLRVAAAEDHLGHDLSRLRLRDWDVVDFDLWAFVDDCFLHLDG